MDVSVAEMPRQEVRLCPRRQREGGGVLMSAMNDTIKQDAGSTSSEETPRRGGRERAVAVGGDGAKG